MLCLQNTKTYCHKLPVCPNPGEILCGRGGRGTFHLYGISSGSRMFFVWFFFNYYDYFKKLQKFKIIYFKNL